MLRRLRMATHLPRLDAELAAGVSPWRSEEHALRAAQLVARRRRYAADLRRAAECRGSGVPVSRAAVLDARPALLALADDLVEVPEPSPRGIALALRLLVDGGGPLYRPWTRGELYAAAEEARHAL
jgi:hypothetical protein